MSNKQITSDPHFFHEKILTYPAMMRFRGGLFSTIEEMNEAIIDSFNKKADDKTESYILGDFCFGYGKKGRERTAEVLNRLKGKIILIGGNHDHANTRDIFREMGHEVHDYVEVRDFENMICMSHYPFRVWNKSHYGSVMMHGHCHGTLQGATGRILDVGWDVHGKVLDLREAYNLAIKNDICRANDHH